MTYTHYFFAFIECEIIRHETVFVWVIFSLVTVIELKESVFG